MRVHFLLFFIFQTLLAAFVPYSQRPSLLLFCSYAYFFVQVFFIILFFIIYNRSNNHFHSPLWVLLWPIPFHSPLLQEANEIFYEMMDFKCCTLLENRLDFPSASRKDKRPPKEEKKAETMTLKRYDSFPELHAAVQLNDREISQPYVSVSVEQPEEPPVPPVLQKRKFSFLEETKCVFHYFIPQFFPNKSQKEMNFFTSLCYFF